MEKHQENSGLVVYLLYFNCDFLIVDEVVCLFVLNKNLMYTIIIIIKHTRN